MINKNIRFYHYILLIGLLSLSPGSWAEDLKFPPGTLLAQSLGDDAYDPFVDYSEFDENSEEEADINFFRNGRFFTLGFLMGYRMPTSGLAQVYQRTNTFGLFLNYFFDMRFSLQLSYVTGDHGIRFNTVNDTSISGNSTWRSTGIDLKYYINTQNVTRGLAKLNPYFLAGFAQVTRTSFIDGESSFGKDTAMGVNLGVGVEHPLLRNKMYLGGQLTYQMINFGDEGSELILGNGEKTGIIPKGDIINLNVILGVNF